MTGMRGSVSHRIKVAVLALLGAVVLVTPVAVDSGRSAAAAPLVRPNIILILTDDQTMESVARMPYVSSRTDWISFDQAYINNGLCCPSRASILTGQYDTRNRVGTNAQGRLLDERETLPVWLRRAGYQTGLFGKYLNQYPFGRGMYVPAGWAQWQAAYSDGPQWQMYPQYNWKLNDNGVSRTFLTAPADYQVNVLGNRMNNWVRTQATARRPFFAMFTPTATHSPWRASPTRAGTLANAQVTRSPSFNIAAPDQPAYLRAQPAANGATMDTQRRKEWEAAASVDDAIRRLDGVLQAQGVFNNTVMIFMTDNGYSFGEHRWRTKRCEFNECSRTPMLVRYPGLAGRHDATHLLSNIDIAATISEIAGATPAIPQDGDSFAPLILGETLPWRDSVLFHWPGGDMEGRTGQPDSMPQFWAVLAHTSDGGRWKYVELDTGERELYDEVADPYEMDNRAGEPAVAAIQAELEAELRALKAEGGVTTTTLRADMPVPGPLGPDLG
jgi:N-acetylglucosamine-6-sulfatase